MKRYCQPLTPVDNPEMIDKNVEAHAPVWPVIIQGKHEVDIPDMQFLTPRPPAFIVCYGL